MLAGRRGQRREDRRELGPVGAAVHYQMRQNLASIGDDFWIENDRGERVYKVDGTALRLRQTLRFEDAAGRELCTIQERALRVKDSMEIEAAGGGRAALVRKAYMAALVKRALIAPLRERWVVSLAGGPDLEVRGNILDHEYAIGEGRDRIAVVSRRWVPLADAYGVQIEPGQDDALILAVTVAIDAMAHPGR